MKEINLETKEKTELSVKQLKEIKHELIDNIIPHDGHTIWQINDKTKEIKKAEYSNVTYVFGEEVKREIITKKGHSYVAALNKKNALKKFNKGVNGSKEVVKEPLNCNPYA